jgi:copper oxidase (laccase) domain-containing protein
MNIDERLEALTHSVELLAAMHKDSEKRMQRLEELVTDIAEGTARLLHVAQVHEQRINDLEGNQSQQ